MTSPVKLNFKIYQGSTFKEVLRWESSTKTYKPITGISQNAPCTIDCAGHGLTTGWRFKVSNVKGMKEINSSEYYIGTADTADVVSINSLNSLDYSAYVSGGVVEYNTPVDLSTMTARMQVREKLDSVITAAATALLIFSSAVYSLELIKGIEVTPFATGTFTLIKEVTR